MDGLQGIFDINFRTFHKQLLTERFCLLPRAIVYAPLNQQSIFITT